MSICSKCGREYAVARFHPCYMVETNEVDVVSLNPSISTATQKRIDELLVRIKEVMECER